MSDPVTTVEIEDVLSSIRRLVSDGDKARVRDGAPQEAAQATPSEAAHPARTPRPEAAPSAEQPSESQTPPRREKLVLTPAYLVSDSAEATASPLAEDRSPVEDAEATAAPAEELSSPDAQDARAEDSATDADDGADEEWQEEPWQEAAPASADIPADSTEAHAAPDDAQTDAQTDAPLTLTGMVWGGDNEPTPDPAPQSSSFSQDRAELVATIAELEAAIRPDVNDYEPDGNEPMSDSVAWPGTSARRFSLDADVEEAQPSAGEEPADAADPATTQAAATADAEAQPHPGAHAVPEDDDTAYDAKPAGVGDHPTSDADEYGDEDLDGLLEADGALLDEETLRALVAEVVREELTGPLGERITRNVRKLVRREIYRVLSSQDFD
ncbi:hypothetical protein [Thalassorhabdomicrobium marinisediminis]|uniref:Uncharacterized protein n=1 Tax=Thalassorhabdomicrobium marinisediminis TaxID=2170577 RepID=A0A2T7FXC6_9RHOB|nr:hypothetical protein [Thalassorhabdomicrobium marinisediminis]PVA06816.1 hypothetical protein DC363_06545 [Thalassorhabdomicrobium marinisediminis]